MTFDEIEIGGSAAFEAWIASGPSETLGLDFKRAASDEDSALFNAKGELTKPGRKTLAKALSAFCNSAGGLVVIGVDCRKVDGIDCAQKLDPVPNFRMGASVLRALATEALQASAEAIRVAGIPSTSNNDAGYLIMEAPQSERRPHMSMGDHRYYRRSGANSHLMEHYEVEDMFRRTTSPTLALAVDLEQYHVAPNFSDFFLRFWLQNTGRISAHLPVLEVKALTNMVFSQGDEQDHTTRSESAFSTITYGSREFSVHPGQNRVFETLPFTVVYVDNVAQEIGGKHPCEAQLQLECYLHAQDMRTASYRFDMKAKLLDLLQRPKFRLPLGAAGTS